MSKYTNETLALHVPGVVSPPKDLALYYAREISDLLDARNWYGFPNAFLGFCSYYLEALEYTEIPTHLPDSLRIFRGLKEKGYSEVPGIASKFMEDPSSDRNAWELLAGIGLDIVNEVEKVEDLE